MNDFEIYPPRSCELDAKLVGFNVSLIPITPDDYSFLDQLFSDKETIIGWRPRGTTISPENFVRLLWEGVVSQYLVTRVDRRDRLGLVSLYNADHRNGLVWLSAIFRPDVHRSGWTFEAISLLIDHAFRVWPFRIIYMEVLEFNLHSFWAGRDSVYNIEGCLVDCEYHDGQYWNKYFLAIHRDRWDGRRKRSLGEPATESEQSS